MSGTPVLEVRDLVVDFNLHQQGVLRAVDGVSFAVRERSTLALVGESGSGKSVISQAIMGILPKSARVASGQILFDDPANPNDAALDIAKQDRDSRLMRDLRGARIAMIFQEPMTSLSPLHTVGNQINESALLHRDVSSAQARELSIEMLSLVGFPDPGKGFDSYPFELSGGLRQRAMIAMSLICRPALLIADEPTTALDVTIQAQILSLMKELQSELGMSLLLITHDMGVVANMADDVAVVYHGKLMERGPVRSLFTNPKHPYLQALMRAVPRIGMDNSERLNPVREVVSTVIKDDAHKHERAGEPLLTVRDIGKRYWSRKSGWLTASAQHSVRALDGVSFDILRGECFGLVGESGCGKTTLSKVIMRAIDPDEGTLTFNDDGTDVDMLGLRGRALYNMRKKIQYIFQDPVSSLNPRMTVFDILSEPLIIHGERSRDALGEAVKKLMAQVGLDPRFLSRYPHSFSGGQRQRIGVARALALRPELILCDEPVSALDVSVQAQVLNLLKDLQRELGLTYMFISHNLAVVDYMADRIGVMCAGKLVEVAPRDILFRNPVHPYTKALMAAVPRVDLDAKLNLEALLDGKVSDPAQWPFPFSVDADGAPKLLDLGSGHWVRAKQGAQTELSL